MDLIEESPEAKVQIPDANEEGESVDLDLSKTPSKANDDKVEVASDILNEIPWPSQ